MKTKCLQDRAELESIIVRPLEEIIHGLVGAPSVPLLRCRGSGGVDLNLQTQESLIHSLRWAASPGIEMNALVAKNILNK